MQADKLYGVIYKFIYLFNVKKNCNKNENQLLFQLTKMGFVIVIKAFHFRTFHRISPIYAIQIQIPAFFFYINSASYQNHCLFYVCLESIHSRQ